jgi:tripartite-type tricarboxylate transporter receptor subunit TctC
MSRWQSPWWLEAAGPGSYTPLPQADGAACFKRREKMQPFARALGIACFAAAGALAASAADAQSVEQFYRGRTVTLTIGLPSGGGYDLYARMLAKHYGRFIPGNPTVVPKNMPGAGGLQASNYMANVAPKDGSEIAMIASSALLTPLFGDEAAKFDPRKYTWIGSINDDVSSCGVWHTTGVTRFEDMMQKEVVFGASGPAAITAAHAQVLKNLLGAKVKVILGYTGTKDVSLAMQRGEVGGSCGLTVSSLKTQWRDEWRNGNLKILIQMGSREHPDLEGVPSIYKYAKSEDDTKVLHLVFDQSILGRPMLAPPGLPADRVKALRDGFIATLKDPQFLADAGKAQMEILPATAAEIDKLLATFYAYPPAIIRKAKQVQGL